LRYTVRLLGSSVWRAIDATVLLAALLVAICAADNIRLPSDLAGLLATRITLSNVLRAAVVFGVWSVAISRLQLYHAEEHRAVQETSRIAIALALAGAALFLSFGLNEGASAADIALRFAGFSFGIMLLIRAVVAALSGAAWRGVRSSQ
jgi:hypothetical protein